jgi:hypothetical protein
MVFADYFEQEPILGRELVFTSQNLRKKESHYLKEDIFPRLAL